MKKWVVEWATSANDPDMLGVDKCSVFVGGLNPNSVTRYIYLMFLSHIVRYRSLETDLPTYFS
jgi:hypothetical protein